MPKENKSEGTLYKLEPETELRLEVDKDEKVFVKLKSGLAENFGTELVEGIIYEYKPTSKTAIYTWHGCTLEVIGKPASIYIGVNTPMWQYMNCHFALENLRVDAAKNHTNGPNAMIVGGKDAGKSTFCRILLNYAVKYSRKPMYVDLDIDEGQIAVPGTIGALYVDRPSPIGEDFVHDAPLVFHVGNKRKTMNYPLFTLLVSQLAEVIRERKEPVKSSGVIINTSSWNMEKDYEQFLHMVREFAVDVILVMDNERLEHMLKRDVTSDVNVIGLPKSGGVVQRTEKMRKEEIAERIRGYFYGYVKEPLYPHSFKMNWADIQIYKIGDNPIPQSCLPFGMKEEDYSTRLVRVLPNNHILNHLLSVSMCEQVYGGLITDNIAGFVCVIDVDCEEQTVTLLSPEQKPLRNNILLLSEVQYMN